MTPEDIERVEADHGASVVWQNGQVGWVCICGGQWPCEVLRLADDARMARAAMRTSYDEVTPGEFWQHHDGSR
jgi:hypothetical protein